MQVAEEQLTGEAVVVAHPRAGNRKAEEPIEQHTELNVAGERELIRELARLVEGGEVAPQLLEGVHPVRQPLADHERVERQLAVAVSSIVNQVP